MARPIKRLQAEPDVVEELRRRVRARTGMVRERERAEMMLLRLDGVGETAARLSSRVWVDYDPIRATVFIASISG